MLNMPSADDRKGSDSADRLGCVSPSYWAMQRAFNVCLLCEKMGHWIQECEEPHKACCRPFHQLQHDHPSFYMQECPFPQHQIGKRGGGKQKHDTSTEYPNKNQCQESFNNGVLATIDIT